MKQSPDYNNPLFSITIEEFIRLQKKLISEELLNITTIGKPSNLTKEHYNFQAAAAYLGISKPTFSKVRKEGKIKGIQVSENRILFTRTELDKYLRNCQEA